MDLDTAAQLGEVFGGLAILITLLFGLRQVSQWNENRRYDIAQSVASHLSSPLIQRGLSVVGALPDEMSVNDLQQLSREEKNALNALLVGMNNHGVMTFHGHLSLDIIASFYQPYTLYLDGRFRKIVSIMYQGTQHIREEKGTTLGPFDWLLWLLNKLDEHPLPKETIY